MIRFVFLVFLASLVVTGSAQDKKLYDEQEQVVTTNRVSIQGKTISYTATTGYLKVTNDEGKHIGNMFHVSYVKQNVTDYKNRPVTFVFNGGPGSSSVWLHMGVMGPYRIQMAADGNAEKAPFRLVQNNYSWLDLTDLVFIDPIGSGFSRPAQDEKADQFYGYENDIVSVSEFIRLWVVQNKRWGSPKYIAGESYGTTRACGVADRLTNEYGMFINGLSLISAALNFQTLREFTDNDFPFIFNLPVYTLTAQYHKVFDEQKNNDADLVKRAETFALEEYSVALLKGGLLEDDEKLNIAHKLSYFTGIPAEVYLTHNLRIPSWMFRKMLLESEGKIVGRFDSRLAMPDPLPNRDFASKDPSYTQIHGAFATGFNEYVQGRLQYANELPFYVIGNVRPWKFGDGKYLNVTPQLRKTMFVNPHMKVWVANGLYDLATSYFGAEYAVNHMNLPAELQKNIWFTYYDAGHMMYLLESELRAFRKDSESFFSR